MRSLIYGIVILIVSYSANAESFVGEFTALQQGEDIVLTLEKELGERYTGDISVGDRTMAVTAHRHGLQLVGHANENGFLHPFMAFYRGELLVIAFHYGAQLTLLPSSTAGATQQKADNKSAAEREVYINNIKLRPAQLKRLETLYRIPIENGHYWYDSLSGAWGTEGGPTAGFIPPGMPLPGSMLTDSSGGGTGLYINGRELHPLDKEGLQQHFGITYEGRYWLDAQGNLGMEGGPMIVNIVVPVMNGQRRQLAGVHRRGFGPEFMALNPGLSASDKSVFWYPGL